MHEVHAIKRWIRRFACFTLVVFVIASLERPESAPAPSPSLTATQNCSEEESFRCCHWYKDYVAFHQREANKLLSGRSDVRTIIYECHEALCGGLGDRLTGIASLFFVAVVTRRALIIDHTKPLPLRESLVPLSDIDWDIAHDLRHLQDRSAHLSLVDKYDKVSADKLFDTASSDVPVLRVSINRYFVGKLIWDKFSQGPYIGSMRRKSDSLCPLLSLSSTSDTFALAYNILFQPSEAVKKRLSEMRHGLKLYREGEHFVAVHARIGGDSVTQTHGFGWTDPIRDRLGDHDRFIDCAQKKANVVRLEHKTITNVTPVVIFSDNESFKRLRVDNFSNVRSLNDTLLFHIDKSDGNDDFNHRGMTDTFAEFVLLTRASCIVASYSSFSGSASGISNVLTGKRCFVHFKRCDEEIDFFDETEPKLD
jgi:hypothetical protein